jgi:simple sugar transport system ATP-binding protein
VIANDDVSFRLEEREIVGLLGENGAGKSTLVKMLFGLYTPDEGTIRVRGTEVSFRDPGDAIDLGIGMVHQHFQLVPPLTVAENIILGAEPRKRRFLDLRTAERQVRELSKRYGLEVDPTALVEDLPVGVQQRVEILKALYRHAEILILDEPTAVLTPQETDELLQVMRDLAASGVGIIFITHKLREVLAVTNRVTVMRGGKVVADVPTEGATQQSLAEAMVGRSVVLRVEKPPAHATDVVLSVRGLRVMDSRGQVAVHDLDLEVRAGEIVGVAGVEGNGQRELVEALSGIRPVVDGAFSVNGHDATHIGPRGIHNLGVAHIPEDREKDGFVGMYSVADNLVLTSYHEEPFARRHVRRLDEVDKRADTLVKRFDVRTPGIRTRVKSLSGGNKQKVIVARELSDPDNRLVIASQPTRGVDVGSIEFIHNQLVRVRDEGVAILLVSAELDEIFGLADRIAVMYEGRIVATLDAASATREQVGLLMAGGGEPSPAVAPAAPEEGPA